MQECDPEVETIESVVKKLRIALIYVLSISCPGIALALYYIYLHEFEQHEELPLNATLKNGSLIEYLTISVENFTKES